MLSPSKRPLLELSLFILPLSAGLAAGACVDPAAEFDPSASAELRADLNPCAVPSILACRLDLECSVGERLESCGRCDLVAALACSSSWDCDVDELMDDCGHDNDHSQKIVPGEVVVASFDDRYGNRYEVEVLVGANYVQSLGGVGDYACMGKCGDGCSPLGFEVDTPDMFEEALGIDSIEAIDIWSRDCLEHDMCSYMFWKGGPAQDQDLDCGDEWVDVYDDFTPPNLQWTSEGAFCAGDDGEGLPHEREHFIGRNGDVICGPDHLLWHCNATDMNEPWSKQGDCAQATVTLDAENAWGDGVCRYYTVKNEHDYPVSWIATVDAPEGEHLEYWSANLLDDQGTSLVFEGADYQATLEPGQTASFGYCREGLSAGCELGSTGCEGLVVDSYVTTQWETGLCRNVSVVNYDTDYVEWQVILEVEGELQSGSPWNAVASDCDGTTCTFSGAGWNDVLTPDDPDDDFPGGGSASFGYCTKNLFDGEGQQEEAPGETLETTVVVSGYKAEYCGGLACASWWEDTEIDVAAGQTVSLSCPDDAGEISWTDGAPQTCAGQEGTYWQLSIAPGCPAWSLVAKVGTDGISQCIGTAGSFVAEEAGRLYLGFNDGDIFSDNSGSWSVDLGID
ncbi:cellulose binding domain-containing protein [Pseudenhygromyxa sp. WMMC2535]|uniref:cellulose binding domain-containing protein n=1 Tax=Pseudenhygromyxa sp. WMMC2535 TaxID=2712867 RepID=UPI001556577F|nr:cellulose binding domain-containing protein [Pseudenhygromyxa sp. WMMC2535]NVB42836.1 cellulose binding domain-containing protein [Pseudenhygromyxa sp. WMMC2535]